MPPRTPDEDDFETVQARWEMADDDVTAESDPTEDLAPRPRVPRRLFKLTHPTECRVCGRPMLIGDDAYGRKLNGRWEIEHPVHD